MNDKMKMKFINIIEKNKMRIIHVTLALILCLGVFAVIKWRHRVADVEINKPIATTQEKSPDIPEPVKVVLKKEYQITNHKDIQAGNPQIILINNENVLLYALSISDKTYKEFKPKNGIYGPIFGPERQKYLAVLPVTEGFGLEEIKPDLIKWGSSGFGDYAICSTKPNSGYFLSAEFLPWSGSISMSFPFRWYSWEYNDGKFSILPINDNDYEKYYLNHEQNDIVMFKGKALITGKSLDAEIKVNTAVITNLPNIPDYKSVSSDYGAFPRLMIDNETIYLFYIRYKNEAYYIPNSIVCFTSSIDGVNWKKPSRITDLTGIIQTCPINDQKGNWILLYNTPVEEQLFLSDVKYNLKNQHKTKLSLIWSKDKGVTWSKPLQVTDGSHADYYPNASIVNGHLRLIWTRYSPVIPHDSKTKYFAGNLITADYGVPGELVK